MEFKEYLKIVLAHYRLIILLTTVTTIIATIGGFSKSSVYEAKTTVVIKSALMQSQVSGFGLVADQSQIKGETYKEMITSRAIAKEIVSILGLDKKQGKKSIKKQSWIVYIKKGVQATIQNIKDFLKYGNVKKIKPVKGQGLINSIQESVSTKLLRKASIIEIIVKHEDPQMAKDIANTAAMVFVDHLKEITSAEATMAKEFIAKRVKVANSDLEKAQNKLLQFIIDEGTVYPEAKINLLLAELVRFESDLKTTDTEIKQITTGLDKINKEIAKYAKTLLSSSTKIINPMAQELKTKLINLEIKKSNLSIDYGPLHPKIQALEKEIVKIRASLKSEVKRIVESEVTTLNPVYQTLLSDLVSKEIDLSVQEAKKNSIKAIITRFPGELQKTAEKQIEWDTLESAVKFAQKNLDSLKLKLEDARIKEAQKISEIRVIDQAILPLYPKGLPKIAYTIIGFIVGLMSGIGISFIIEYLDDSVKSIDELEEEIKLPVYGHIPEIKVQTKGKKKRDTTEKDEISIMENRLVTHYEPKSLIAEAYRSFRTNIQFANTRMFLVTSSFKGEGKTTTVANIAITLAQAGNRTLLIDVDLRSPMVHNIFMKVREPGLSNVIGGFANTKEVIQPSGIENLDIIPSGPIPPNPAELLTSQRCAEFLETIKPDYDYVLFDTPPVLAVTDATILSSKIKDVFMVIKAGKTSKRDCKRAIHMLEQVSANILGSVLNNIKIENRFSYGYYHQQYYYGEEKEKA